MQIGELIYQLRKAEKISREELRRGLVSISELSRIENGEREPDSFLVSALLQRLGKSMTHFELIVTGNESQQLMLRELIQSNMLAGNLEEADRLLREYEECPDSGKTLHQQYIHIIQGVLEYLRYGNREACMEKMRTALGLSFSAELASNWRNCYFCLQEIQVMIIIAYLQITSGKSEGEEMITLLHKLLEYIEHRFTSDDAKAGVYTKCCYVLAKAHEERGEREQAYEVCKKGIDYLRNMGLMTLLYELLEIRQKCRSDKQTACMLEALRFLQEFAGNPLPEGDMLKLMFLGEAQEMILGNELLKGARMAKKMSQEKLCADVCARETIAQIESGKRTPHQKMMKILLTRLGVDREKYYGYVVAKDFETYEMVKKYKKKLIQGKETECLLAGLEQRLDNSIPVNRQFLEEAKTMLDRKCEQIGDEETVIRLEKCLRYTMPEYDGAIYRIPSREEFIILNNIALYKKQSGKEKEALCLYSGLYEKYKESEVALAHHMQPLTMLYLNYVRILGECGNIKEAETYGKEGLKLMVKFQRGDMAALLLEQLCCVYEKYPAPERENWSSYCCQYLDSLMNFFRCEKTNIK